MSDLSTQYHPRYEDDGPVGLYVVELISPLRNDSGLEQSTLLIIAADWQENAHFIRYKHIRIPISNVRQISEYTGGEFPKGGK